MKKLDRESTTTISISAANQHCCMLVWRIWVPIKLQAHETFQLYLWDGNAFVRPLILQMEIGRGDHLTSGGLSACLPSENVKKNLRYASPPNLQEQCVPSGTKYLPTYWTKSIKPWELRANFTGSLPCSEEGKFCSTYLTSFQLMASII